MTPAQLRMARVALRIGVRELASMAGVTTATITRYENERGGLLAATRDKIQAALESAGITFLDEGDIAGGPGVSLRQEA
ncbi:helix-turn-helix transcriptional regulator [Neorhizobium sp. CSC1952]|uniref:helix-turn-helix domain-containing protein n=1 Tax=Neorhizobium sp. CSC1952 TaxID=2978974 RepID=UPI0025A4FEA4|nr:helix-turn-helix transcriptional regulator [Rhizobium sp. CSC1952]WJR68146.1 helix-turn-helix transcriptional regulator [Rhizobium sp. CSC1952]